MRVLFVTKVPRNAKSVITQIRVDDAVKAKIIARLGLKATHLTSDRVSFNRLLSLYTTNEALSDGEKPLR